jgi:hypothetical protein
MAIARALHTPHCPTTAGRKGIDTSETQKVRSLLERLDMKRVSIVEWYRILRVHHEWTIFQAIRFALWLAR